MPQLFETPVVVPANQVREDSVEANEWRRQAGPDERTARTGTDRRAAFPGNTAGSGSHWKSGSIRSLASGT